MRLRHKIVAVATAETHVSKARHKAPSFFSPAQTREFRTALLAWFDVHKRDLPWRRTRDPYAIWVSEIMLQQTRVAAVLEHYANWMVRFPDVETLAAAQEDEVLAHWSGLGYYRRARFLHRGARTVIEQHEGRIPGTSEALRRLPGIGEYTSAAIASIAFGEPVAVVDGNVERVMLRIAGIDGESKGPAATRLQIRNAADWLLDPSRPGDFNQAMMELGATVCLPRNPLCLHCPAHKFCRTRGEHMPAPRKQMKSEDAVYAFVRRTKAGVDQVLLQMRSREASVMAGMWELPAAPDNVEAHPVLLKVGHAIMQTNYRVRVVELAEKQVRKLKADRESVVWVAVDKLASLPLTGLARKIFKRTGLLSG